MADPTAAFKLMPGFDFLQGLVKNAGSAIPNVGQWVAPTMNPEEIEKRIDELRTVQFWLEQNARMLGATIQALEVQRMTLSTLKTMNLSFGDLAESLKIRLPEAPEAPEAAAPPPAPAAPTPKPRAAAAEKPEQEEKAEPRSPGVPPGVVDPMQLWGALTKQFTELATNAMKDTASQAAKNIAGAMAKQGFEAAGETLKKAAAMPGEMAKSAASAAQNAAQRAASVAQAAAGISPAKDSSASAKAGAKTGAARKRSTGTK